MVDYRGRIHARQIGIMNVRSRLHSPLFRNRSSAASTSSSTVDEEDEPIVRETPLYRNKKLSKAFFGKEYDEQLARSPRSIHSSMTLESDDGTRTPHARGRSATSSTINGDTTSLHLETDSETHTSVTGAMDASWDLPILSAENISKALSYAPPAQVPTPESSFPHALAVSSGISDSLARMKMRKQEMEMAALVQKVQAQLRTMEDVIKELQNEHAIKNTMLKKQIAETNRVKAERNALRKELAETKTASSTASSSTTDTDLAYLQSSLQSFMHQTEHTQFLMMEQLKTMSTKGSSPRRGSVDAQKIEDSVKAAMGEVADLQRNMMAALDATSQGKSPSTPPKTPTASPPKTPTSPPKARALPSPAAPAPAAPSSSWKTAFVAMIGIWLVTLGVGAGHHIYGHALLSSASAPTDAADVHDLMAQIQSLERELAPLRALSVHAVKDDGRFTPVQDDALASEEPVTVDVDAAGDLTVPPVHVNATLAIEEIAVPDAVQDDSTAVGESVPVNSASVEAAGTTAVDTLQDEKLEEKKFADEKLEDKMEVEEDAKINSVVVAIEKKEVDDVVTADSQEPVVDGIDKVDTPALNASAEVADTKTSAALVAVVPEDAAADAEASAIVAPLPEVAEAANVMLVEVDPIDPATVDAVTDEPTLTNTTQTAAVEATTANTTIEGASAEITYDEAAPANATQVVAIEAAPVASSNDEGAPANVTQLVAVETSAEETTNDEAAPVNPTQVVAIEATTVEPTNNEAAPVNATQVVAVETAQVETTNDEAAPVAVEFVQATTTEVAIEEAVATPAVDTELSAAPVQGEDKLAETKAVAVVSTELVLAASEDEASESIAAVEPVVAAINVTDQAPAAVSAEVDSSIHANQTETQVQADDIVEAPVAEAPVEVVEVVAAADKVLPSVEAAKDETLPALEAPIAIEPVALVTDAPGSIEEPATSTPATALDDAAKAFQSLLYN